MAQRDHRACEDATLQTTVGQHPAAEAEHADDDRYGTLSHERLQPGEPLSSGKLRTPPWERLDQAAKSRVRERRRRFDPNPSSFDRHLASGDGSDHCGQQPVLFGEDALLQRLFRVVG